MSASTLRVLKVIGLAVAAPSALYFMVFHSLQCETDAEQIAAAVMGLAGLGAAIRWA